MSDGNKSAFEQAAADQGESLVSELIGFMRDNKKWWLMPIFVAFLAVGALVLLAATPAAPFIYTLF